MSATIPIPHPSADCELLTQIHHYLAERQQGRPLQAELEAAWKRFYEVYDRKIRAFAFKCGIAEVDISDCAQDVWTELMVRLPTFQFDPKRGKFDTWLFEIVRGKSADLTRSRQSSQLQEQFNALQSMSDHCLPPGKNLEEEEVVILALEGLKKQLNACTFQVLWLRLIEQRSVPEVAQVLGLSHEQVWYRFHRARRELEQICSALTSGERAQRSALSLISEKSEKCQDSAQGTSLFSVSRIVGTNLFGRRGGTCVDYVFQRLELGRRELNPEWKVEWNCNGEPTPVLYIRRTAMVAFAEICGSVETVAAHWPRIVQAAIAAGGLAGIATIIATPTLALPVFYKEFHKQLHGKGGCPVEEEIRIALSAKQEANGPWCECKS